MLPKRLSKRNQSSVDGQQLELKNTISSRSRLKKKRRLLLFAFGFTVGLSILFSIYRLATGTITGLNFSLPSIKAPIFNLSRSTKVNLAEELKPLLPRPDSWSVYVKTLSPPLFSWSLNSPHPKVDPIIDQLSSLPASSSGLIQPVLPQGALFQENLNSQNEFFEYGTLISVPGQQIFIFIKGSNPELIPSLVQTIYWQIIRNL